ncbi:MAG TPA: alkaline phosphatase family protein [Thermoanaerobaculia bacterium]
MRRLLALVLLAVAFAAGFLWLRRDPASAGPRPLVVIGIDGGEWKVIRRLWEEGKLPHLEEIAERGVSGTLRTAYNSSPVIWTTIATGVRPPEHGITDFVVPTPKGDVPISSDVRKVPALWNMLSKVGRRVAVLGWWGSWPAEEVNGVVVTDRALLDLGRRVSPSSYLPRFLEDLQEARESPGLFRAEDEAELRDAVITNSAVRLAGEKHDLLLAYFRSPDIVSHNFWKYFEPEAFQSVDPRDLEAYRGRVPQVYEAVDQAIGRILDAAPRRVNVLVLSDHGFHAARKEEVKILLDMDTVLERLGYLARSGGAIDFTRSRVYTYGTPSFRRAKFLRFVQTGREPGGTVRPEEREALRRRLAADLAAVTYETGAPVFHVRDARPQEARQGADFVAGVSPDGATRALRVRGERFDGAISDISRISGTHTTTTHGVFFAAGPDIDPDAEIEGIHIHDMAPTILYGLGLPVAESFAGRAWTELYSEDFRAAHPLRKIRSWGARRGGSARTSAADEKLLEELRALGYIN